MISRSQYLVSILYKKYYICYKHLVINCSINQLSSIQFIISINYIIVVGDDEFFNVLFHTHMVVLLIQLFGENLFF